MHFALVEVEMSEGRQSRVWSMVHRLKYLFAAYSEPCSAVEHNKQLSKTFLKWASASIEGDKLYKFYVISVLKDSICLSCQLEMYEHLSDARCDHNISRRCSSKNGALDPSNK